ncbi:MAG: thioredoxin family protein [Chloroflexota bacterium]|nr:thioredoxin family protein [Chloroflexota bacterium]
MLIDEEGVVRWTKFGGFSVEKPEDVSAVERFLAGEDPGPNPGGKTPYALGPVERDLVATKLRLGRLLDEVGRRDEAVAVWRDALHLDPENLTIRKQIWAVEHPEKFHPTIDWDWQREQLRAEREREIAEGVRGPDGCPVPRATSGTQNREGRGACGSSN